MEEYSAQEREGKPKGDDEILACSKEANTKFGRTKTKGLAMKRRTIAQFRKDQNIPRILRRRRGQDITT